MRKFTKALKTVLTAQHYYYTAIIFAIIATEHAHNCKQAVETNSVCVKMHKQVHRETWKRNEKFSGGRGHWSVLRG